MLVKVCDCPSFSSDWIEEPRVAGHASRAAHQVAKLVSAHGPDYAMRERIDVWSRFQLDVAGPLPPHEVHAEFGPDIAVFQSYRRQCEADTLQFVVGEERLPRGFVTSILPFADGRPELASRRATESKWIEIRHAETVSDLTESFNFLASRAFAMLSCRRRFFSGSITLPGGRPADRGSGI